MNRIRIILIVTVVAAAALTVFLLLREQNAPTVEETAPPATAGRRDPTRPPPPPPAERPVDPNVEHLPQDLIAATLRHPVILGGAVESIEGTPPVGVGATCRVGIERTDDPALCRVIVECGTSRLHGDPLLHDTRCGFDGSGALVLLDDGSTNRVDHDASLTFDGNLLTVRDDEGNVYGDYTLTLRLHALPSGGNGTR